MTPYVTFFADGEHEFKLTPALVIELETKCGAGLLAICHRVFARQCSQADIIETIRLALIGGGMSPKRAAEYARKRNIPLDSIPRIKGWGHRSAPIAFEHKVRASAGAEYIFPQVRRAIEDAGISPDAIDYVNAHGTATALNDPSEAEAMGRIFGERLAEVPVSSTKPVHGHALGAAGALELVCTIMALRDKIAPPTINFLEADPKCPVDCVPNAARPVPIRTAMSNSFAFGGVNASLIVQASD